MYLDLVFLGVGEDVNVFGDISYSNTCPNFFPNFLTCLKLFLGLNEYSLLILYVLNRYENM